MCSCSLWKMAKKKSTLKHNFLWIYTRKKEKWYSPQIDYIKNKVSYVNLE
jgi:hypothetical protein